MNQTTTFAFDDVLFFGRSIDEYRTMFNLEPESLDGKTVLDCGAGPAALTAQAHQWNINMVACDPLYSQAPETLRALSDRDADSVRSLQSKTLELFDEDVRRANVRRQDMDTFLSDYEAGKEAGRYVTAELAALPFEDNTFDLTLVGNFLFLYSDTKYGGILKDSPYDYTFHWRSLQELVRVTKGEVRVYPLNGPEVQRHAFLDHLMKQLADEGIKCELVPVKHQDIKTAQHLLRLTR